MTEAERAAWRACRAAWPSSQVGAQTETELKEKKLRVEDALNATKVVLWRRGPSLAGSSAHAVHLPPSAIVLDGHACMSGLMPVLRRATAPLWLHAPLPLQGEVEGTCALLGCCLIFRPRWMRFGHRHRHWRLHLPEAWRMDRWSCHQGDPGERRAEGDAALFWLGRLQWRRASSSALHGCTFLKRGAEGGRHAKATLGRSNDEQKAMALSWPPLRLTL